MEPRNRRNAALIEIEHDVRQYATDLYVKVTTVRLIMSGATGLDVCETCRLVWYLGRPIANVSLSVLDKIF